MASLFFAFNPHVLVCTLRLKASKRLALFQIELRIPTLHLLKVYKLLLTE
ncbi:periplasmic domain protein [Rickettsia felis str. Pedreira]|uniref:Periplasmic domain protein n=1 Tax=Rickettsia felis str. Pedreira TaxID=1359196 RepID=A0A0F3MS77_RICFI|nr:periplasmic domain protein [Rickettsia felis str. Pedreira]